jgi:F0F1-type ATP synthase epsilon subunit
MEFKIVSPQETKIYTILWLEVFTQLGSFVIQPGHAPTVLTPLPNKDIIFGLTNGKRETIKIPHGVLEVGRHKAVLLINQPL